MFKQITSTSTLSVGGIRFYRFIITDSCFQEIIMTRSGYVENYLVVAAIIQVYKRRNLNVPSNLVHFYRYLENSGYHINSVVLQDHCPNLDHTHKELQFGKLYLPALKQRLRKIFYGF